MKSVQRVSIVQQVVDNIRELITSGEVEAGQKLPSEKDLCEKMNVGRGTIREAFRVLQAGGLVEIKPGRGAFVASMDETPPEMLIEWFVQNKVELRDCIEIRGALEPLAIRLGIQRATHADIAQIGRTHEKFLTAVEAHIPADIAKYDERFHNQIVEMSQNRLLISINRKVSMCIQAFRAKTFLVEQNIQNAVGPHTNILSAIRERDAEGGEFFMRRHLLMVMEDLLELTEGKPTL